MLGDAVVTGTFRRLEDRPIHWTDAKGIVHVCEGADVHRGVRLIWTLCNKDVPANGARLAGDKGIPTCDVCISAP